MHYKNKDVPLATPRMDFTTLEDFELLASCAPANIQALHILVDAATYAILCDQIEDFKYLRLTQAGFKAPIPHDGYVCYVANALVFTDAWLPVNKQWVNDNGQAGRPQFLIVPEESFKPYIPLAKQIGD